MASAVATENLFSRFLMGAYDHDPGSTSAKVISADGGTTEIWVDMRDYSRLAVVATDGALTGNGITLLEIVASDSEDETDTSVTVVKTSGTVAADALGDYVVEECSAEEIAHLASTYDLRYATARLTLANAADEAIVFLIAESKRPTTGLTADTIA